MQGVLKNYHHNIVKSAGIIGLVWIVWIIYCMMIFNIEYVDMLPRSRVEIPNASQRNFAILFYASPSWFGNHLSTLRFFDDCDYKNCWVSFDNSTLEKSDVVIFDHATHVSAPKKVPNQAWVLLSLETPHNTNTAYRNADFKGKFDWTMTYRHDSEGYDPYGLVTRRKTLLRKNYTSLFLNKTRDVAWVVSHCSTISKREKYVKELQKYISVDIYGNCGKACKTDSAEDCKKMLSKTYKFYLSFENNLCKDYLTEKITTIYLDGMDFIPVVRGASNAGNYLPKNTFIMSSDFKSPHHLAKHLKMIGSNESYYISILKEKDKYYNKVSSNARMGTCNICKKLNNGYNKNNTFDLEHWLWKDQCQNPTDVRQ